MTHFVIFGSTGDLTQRKLIPAIYNLVVKGQTQTVITAVGRKDFTTASYKGYILTESSNRGNTFDQSIWSSLRMSYHLADLDKRNSLVGLKAELERAEAGSSYQRVFYLAMGSNYFSRIAEQLKRFAIYRPGKDRVVFEKPFGEDLKTFRKLERGLARFLNGDDIYRIDHYLGKETVQNLVVIRFFNPLFERVWNSSFIDHITVVSDEDMGIGRRAEYYNNTGAIRDMIQNHLLQVASLILMEPPEKADSRCMHQEKLRVLKSLDIMSASQIKIGQYEGYRNELSQSGLPDKGTETFAEVELFSRSKRWKGTPIILRTGKMLGNKEAFIEITFKQCFGDYCPAAELPSNRLKISIQPSQDVIFQMNTRRKPDDPRVESVNLEFCHECSFGPNSIEAYEKLLLDCISGDKTLFITSEELAQAWRITDRIIELRKGVELHKYPDGSKGP